MRSLLLMAVIISALTACGKKGALYYPDMLVPAAPTAISATQIGEVVRLQFVLPDNDRVGRKLHDLAGVKINKRESDSSLEQVCSSCMTDYRLFRTLYLDLLSDGAQRYGNTILMLDGDVRAGKGYAYSVVPFTKEGVAGLASPQVSVRFVPAALPPVIKAESFPTEIRISCVSAPPLAGRVIGCNIYRATQQDLMPYLPINREPVMGRDYIDSGLERNMKYRYQARAVIQLESGDQIESQASNVVEGLLKDDE